MKKMLISMICTLFMISASVFPIFADTNNDNVINEEHFNSIIKISNPKTNQTWEWEIAKEDINITTLQSTVSGDEQMKISSVSVNAGKYLAETMGKKSGYSGREDDIILRTGLVYSADSVKNTVRIYNVFGSTYQNGQYYYPTNRRVYWRNPGAGIGGKFFPTSNSWNYSVDSSPGFYETSTLNFPYSLLDCDVRISGMSSKRTVSVMYNLNDL